MHRIPWIGTLLAFAIASYYSASLSRLWRTYCSPALVQIRSSPLPPPSATGNSDGFRAFSSSSTAMAPGSKHFLDAIANRRTNLAIKDTDLPISDEQIADVLKTVALVVPSPYNSQSTRMVALLKQDHKTFWDMVAEIMAPHLKGDSKKYSEQRLASFRGGYGTVLFFEDPEPIEEKKKQYPYAEHQFPIWSEQTNAMHQLALWTALTEEGLGVSLQHYNPLIDERTKQGWNVPAAWSLKAQLVFGAQTAEAKPKPNRPIDEMLTIHGL